MLFVSIGLELWLPLTYNWKSENVIYCCLTANILTKLYQKCFWSSPLRYTWLLPEPLNLICCLGNRIVKFAKNYLTLFISEAIWRMKLKNYRNVHNKLSLSSSLCFIRSLSKLLILIGCHGNRNIKFVKQYLNNISSEVIWEIKLKLS